MTFECLKSKNLIISRRKRAFEVNLIIFFFVSRVLSFSRKKQTSKNVADTTFTLCASAAASEICEWVQIGIDVYIPHRKYQVTPRSSPWF